MISVPPFPLCCFIFCTPLAIKPKTKNTKNITEEPLALVLVKMNFLGWFWVRVATTGHLSCLVSPIHCKHENKTYAAAPRSFIPNTHSSPSPAIGNLSQIGWEWERGFLPISVSGFYSFFESQYMSFLRNSIAMLALLVEWRVLAQNMFSYNSASPPSCTYNHTARRALPTEKKRECRSLGEV